MCVCVCVCVWVAEDMRRWVERFPFLKTQGGKEGGREKDLEINTCW